MRKSIGLVFVVVLVFGMLVGCSNDALYSEASAEVDAYNSEALAYNDKADAYNQAVQHVKDENQQITVATSNAQSAINSDGRPFDESTLTDLKNAMAAADSAKVAEPAVLPVADTIEINDEMSREELEDAKKEAAEKTEELKNASIPEAPVAPDYTDVLGKLDEALKAYENSVQSLKQITAPSDEFVIDRLKTVKTITNIEAVTEKHDPNGLLNKQGGYIGCVYFRDKQVKAEDLYLDGGAEDVIEIGTDGGGAVEIFKTEEEAQARNDYLASFDGSGFLSPGSHQVEGTIIIRTSDELTATQQQKLTQRILNALTKVE